MCLAIPMRIVSINGFTARCEAKGAARDVSLAMMRDQPLAPGDIVTIHLGYARAKLSEADAEAIWAIYDEILEAEEIARAREAMPCRTV